MKQIIKYIVLIFCVANIQAQNLVRNPGFETFRDCDYRFGQFDSTYSATTTIVPYWCNANRATPDYHNLCNTDTFYGVPYSRFGYQTPRASNGMMGCFTLNASLSTTNQYNTYDYREYIQTKLMAPLIKNHFYKVKFYVNFIDPKTSQRKAKTQYNIESNVFAIDDIGAHFTKTKYYQDNVEPIRFNTLPQVNSPRGTFLNDSVGWTLIEGCFKAEGGEQWLILGNFTLPQYTNRQLLTDSISINGISFYFFDDVSVEEITTGYNFSTSTQTTSLCPNGTIALQARNGYQNYTWSTRQVTQQITATDTGKYVVVSSNNNCDWAIDTFKVVTQTIAPILIQKTDSIICGNPTSVAIGANIGFTNYQWNTGANTQNINVSQSGNYICTATNACGESVRDSIQITFIADVQLELGDNITTCAPNHTITAPAGFTSYAWNNGSTTPQLNVTQSGNYSLTASTPCGSKSDNVQITFKTPPTLQIPETEYLCTTASKTITATGNFDQIHWSNGNTTPQITITEGGTYTATASNYCGQIRKSIAVDTCTRHYSIYIPNAFTPNGDNINDELKVYGNNIQLKTLAIYNRWGEKLFETNDINKGWDGINSDEPLPADTYVYYVEIVTPSKEEVIKRKGDVLLIR